MQWPQLFMIAMLSMPPIICGANGDKEGFILFLTIGIIEVVTLACGGFWN